MQGEVRFSKDDSPGDAGWLTVRVVKGMEQAADDCQAVALAGVDTE